MLRRAADTCALRCSQLARPRPISLRCLSGGQVVYPGTDSRDEKDIVEARRWLASFNLDTIPKNLCDISFSRASGPGGQNVNKVNSKATLRVPLHSLLPILPRILRPEMQSSRFYAPNAHAIVIQADSSRKQSENVEECFRKLHSLIDEIGKLAVPGETSTDQKERVKKLKKAENEARVKAKKLQSSKKAGRRSTRDDY